MLSLSSWISVIYSAHLHFYWYIYIYTLSWIKKLFCLHKSHACIYRAKCSILFRPPCDRSLFIEGKAVCYQQDSDLATIIEVISLLYASCTFHIYCSGHCSLFFHWWCKVNTVLTFWHKNCISDCWFLVVSDCYFESSNLQSSRGEVDSFIQQIQKLQTNMKAAAAWGCRNPVLRGM